MTPSASCDLAMSEAAGGVAAALEAVNCVAAEVTGATFGRLFAPGGALVTVLTILLTLYVAFFALQLVTGRSTLGVSTLTPKMLRIGLVLTFVTSWVAYQAVFWNIFVDGPDWLASVLTGDDGSATQTFATKVDVVFAAVQQASEGQTDIQAFSPPGMLWMGALLFMLGTVGLLVTTRIALALLVALGPIFLVMALFDGTRGLFVGWLKGLTMMALTPLFAVLGGSIMLEMSVPILAALNMTPGDIPARAAMAFFMIGAVHVALMAMALKVMTTMVSGWTVFGLANSDGEKGRGSSTMSAPTPAPAAASAYNTSTASQPAASSAARRTAVVAATPVAANDAGGSGGGGSGGARVTNVYATSSGSGQQGATSKAASRTNGLGMKFKGAPATGKTPRQTEKVK
ncbi:type IV secretion system protein [Alteriqipengyuania lutimaris]|uniref:Type VI secretion protein n=1 Tax=Alteriqipengyuania lutimaris TaxID=1538146 RepID=A0A395LQG5_9SPHN|nr:type IV secretion system protein [Alteriqipengyuania lutimaris]MBB3033127.1 type IV secretion system protein VirB6 [Alteriqipengyuania lutimaris]RDS77814.1 type VI secretion protein [Alteriqipengyuania lutimaris]